MRIAVCCVVVVAGCAHHHAGGEPDAAPELDGGPCGVVVTHETPLVAASHVPQGTDVQWTSNPPSSGPHYPTRADWAITYPIVVERGNYLHNEEHGGVALLYNCAAGAPCPDVISGLTAIGQALPQDPACAPPINAKWLVTADPYLPDGVQVAAAAWGWTLKASCLDADRVAAFVAARYEQGGPDRYNCGGPILQ